MTYLIEKSYVRAFLLRAFSSDNFIDFRFGDKKYSKVASENDAKREGHREVSENFSLACDRDQANQTILSMHRWNFD